jgi:hypothetical protein
VGAADEPGGKAARKPPAWISSAQRYQRRYQEKLRPYRERLERHRWAAFALAANRRFISVISLLITGLDVSATAQVAFARAFTMTPLRGLRRHRDGGAVGRDQRVVARAGWRAGSGWRAGRWRPACRARRFRFLIRLPHEAMSHQAPRRVCERS